MMMNAMNPCTQLWNSAPRCACHAGQAESFGQFNDNFVSSRPESGMVCFKDMLALKAQPAAAARGAQVELPVEPNDFGTDANGVDIDPKNLPEAPIHTRNPRVQKYLNFMYATKTGKQELDALAKKNPDIQVKVGNPPERTFGEGDGGEYDKDTNTIYLNPSSVREESPLAGAGMLAHEIWHALSPYKNSFAQEKTADDIRVSVSQQLEDKFYGPAWMSKNNYESIDWKNDSVYGADFTEYDGGSKPPVGKPARELAAAKKLGIQLNKSVVRHGNQIFNEYF